MAMVSDWNGREIPVRRSRGGVLTFERWQDNVLRGDTTPWPPAQLLKQVSGYPAQLGYFHPEDADALKADLGDRISRFQSVNSEDAVTWSWFGTLGAAEPETRRDRLAV